MKDIKLIFVGKMVVGDPSGDHALGNTFLVDPAARARWMEDVRRATYEVGYRC